MKSLIEQLRFQAISSLFPLKGFGPSWNLRRKLLLNKLGNAKSPRDVLALGDVLSEAFRVSGAADRSQGGVSQAGSTWEALIVWYLNLCLVGTKAVVVRGAPLCPSPVRDAMSVTYEGSILRSEPDVILISNEALAKAPPEKFKKNLKLRVDEIVEQNFASTGVINLQCKTNWNDSAQVPMLWNMLYNQARKGALIPNGFAIGRNGFSLQNLGAFWYGFVTVPTQDKDAFKPTTLAVMRVKTVSAGHYWGHPTKNGVCFSIKELFNRFNLNTAVFPNVADVGTHASAFITDSAPQHDLDVFQVLERF